MVRVMMSSRASETSVAIPWKFLKKFPRRFLALLGMTFFVSLAFAESDENLMRMFSEALRSGEAQIKVSYTATSKIENDNLEEAKNQALKSGFQNIIQLATQAWVSYDRLKEVETWVQTRIYNRARNFISHFRSLPPTVSEENYELPLEVTVRVSDLYKALVENKIILVNYEEKEIVIKNARHAKDYQWIRETLEKEVRHLKRLVEKYQKKNEVKFLIETSSSIEDISRVLTAARSDNAPSFSLVNHNNILEIKLLK